MARARQQVLTGLAPQFFSEVDEAVNQYVNARDALKDAKEAEESALTFLLSALKTQKLKRYQTPENVLVQVKHAEKDKVSVKVPKTQEPSENGQEEAE